MAICETLHTGEGVARFLLQSENGDEYITAFEYENKKIEVHSLKRECAALYLDEDTAVATIKVDDSTVCLVAVGPHKSSHVLEFRLWDVTSPLGFALKDVCNETSAKHDGKTKLMFNVKKELECELASHIITSFNQYLAVVINKRFCITWTVSKLDSGGAMFEKKSVCDLKPAAPVSDAILLKKQQGELYAAFCEGSSLSVWSLEDGVMSAQRICTVQPKLAPGGTTVQNFFRVTPSKCLVIDDLGSLNLLDPPSTITPIKLPSLMSKHNICSVVGFKHTSEGLFAVVSNSSTINIYSLADLLCSVEKGVSSYIRPVRAILSSTPVNAITFVRADQLLAASTATKTLTFWGGITVS